VNPETISRRPFWRRPAAVAAGLALLTLAVYLRAAGCAFLNYDDISYVTDNAHVRTGLTLDNVRWALTTNYYGLVHPLVWLSLMLDATLFGVRATAFHLVNLAWHTANAVLLFLVLRRMTRALWPAALVAALFALHPQHVEPVAWISARKDLLSTFFGLLSLAAYVHYARRPGVLRYLPVMLFYALGLLSKAMLVTLPGVLLLLDYWPLRRWPPPAGSGAHVAGPPDAPDFPARSSGFLLLEKVPLLLLALAAVWLGLHTGWTVVNSYPHEPSPWLQTANGLIAYATYVLKTFWPAGLACPYPYPYQFAPAKTAAAVALLGAITALAVLQRRRRPYLLVGWLWYAGMLVPVSGFLVAVPGYQSLADRYTYLPLVGVFLMLVWLGADLAAARPAGARWLGGLAAAALLACAVLTVRQLGFWRNNETFYQRCLAVTTGNAIAHNNYAAILFAQGKDADAAAQFRAAIRDQPAYFEGHLNLGHCLLRLGRAAEARDEFLTATRLMPGNPLGWEALQQTEAAPSAP